MSQVPSSLSMVIRCGIFCFEPLELQIKRTLSHLAFLNDLIIGHLPDDQCIDCVQITGFKTNENLYVVFESLSRMLPSGLGVEYVNIHLKWIAGDLPISIEINNLNVQKEDGLKFYDFDWVSLESKIKPILAIDGSQLLINTDRILLNFYVSDTYGIIISNKRGSYCSSCRGSANLQFNK